MRKPCSGLTARKPLTCINSSLLFLLWCFTYTGLHTISGCTDFHTLGPTSVYHFQKCTMMFSNSSPLNLNHSCGLVHEPPNLMNWIMAGLFLGLCAPPAEMTHLPPKDWLLWPQILQVRLIEELSDSTEGQPWKSLGSVVTPNLPHIIRPTPV